MKITAIKPQLKRAGWYAIFIDGDYSFSLSETALLQSKLAPKQDIDKATLKELKRVSGDDKAYNQALRFLSIRARSVWELESYLQRKNLSEETIKPIVARLTKIKLLDDRAFARSWVEGRTALKPSSTRKIRLELRQKRVNDSIITETLGDQKLYNSNALGNLIEQKRRQLKYRDDQKLMQYLARQGFSYDDIKTAISDQL